MSARRARAAEPPEPEDEARLYGRALRLLAAHDRTAFDLRRRLERHGTAEAAARVIARLEAQHYLDDRRFAEAFTQREALDRGAGARLVRAGLRAHGVAEPLVAEAAALAQEVEAATALALARKGAERLRGLAPEVQVRRLASQLARRGYRPQIIYQAVRQALEPTALGGAGEEAFDALGALDETSGASEEAPEPADG